ncbi:MAG: response regulator [Mucilaginibacter sp.]
MNKEVVVIEDDRDILDIIRYILADEGYNVTGFDRLDGAQQIVEKQPAVVLLDNRLADGYGNKFCASLKSNPITAHIPVILVSASANLEQLAKQCNADAFLPKPFNLDDLIRIVKRYAETPGTHTKSI